MLCDRRYYMYIIILISAGPALQLSGVCVWVKVTVFVSIQFVPMVIINRKCWYDILLLGRGTGDGSDSK